MKKTFRNRIAQLFIISCSLLIVGCGAHLKNLNQNEKYSFDLQGHRGCRGWMPENTIPAMLKAIDLGVNTLEMDAQISQDLQVVISHDPYFNQYIATKPDGNAVTAAEEKSLKIFTMPYDSIKRYDVGLRGNPLFPQQQKMAVAKPLLTNLIDTVEAYLKQHKKKSVFYSIEIKSSPAGDGVYHPTVPQYAKLLMEVIQEKKLENRVVIQSFDERAIQYIRNNYPGIQTAFLVEDKDPRTLAKQLEELGFTPTIYSPYYKRVTPLLVQQCADLHMRLIPWTINSKEEFQRLRDMGVNGIITDYPPAGN
jgi:glycerophosphoryl diester phosphodiesterase